MALNKHYLEDTTILEIGVDEAGRGPLFGRVYAAAVILPKDPATEYDFSQMKDSKKFHSKKKIAHVADYIKQNAIAWSVAYEDEAAIDKMNILQATQSAMHKAIKSCIENAEKKALLKCCHAIRSRFQNIKNKNNFSVMYIFFVFKIFFGQSNLDIFFVLYFLAKKTFKVKKCMF